MQIIMNALERLAVLYMIGRGATDIEAIASEVYPLRKNEVRLIVDQFSRKGLVETEKGLHLTKYGLLNLSRQIARCGTDQSEYFFWSIDGLPFFRYKNMLHRDIITHPDLFFEPASRYVGDEMLRVYETSLPEIDFETESVEIIDNLLFETDYLHPTGFWLLKLEKKKLCGWSAVNLTKTLVQIKEPSDLIFVCAYQNFVLLISSRLDAACRGKMHCKVYITKAIFPYVDTMDFLADRLKAFLIFNGLSQMPMGHEIKAESSPLWRRLSETRPKFIPKLIGKILYRTGVKEASLFSYVFAVTLPRELSDLGAVSPWFITCPGGCLDQEFRRLHYVHLFQTVSLPEIELATLMINNT